MEVIKRSSKHLIVPDISKLKILKSDETGSSFIYKERKYDISLFGEYQIENALTAIETAENSGYNISYETVKAALADTYFPARAEIICKAPLVLLDGAHNPDGARALADIMKKYSGKITAVIGVMRDKDYKQVLETTLAHCKNSVAVTVEGMPRSLPACSLAETASEFCPCTAAESYASAIKKADEISKGEPIFVFGSLYLAGGIRDKLKDFYKNFN